MKKLIARRDFIKKSAGTTLGAMVLPGSFIISEGCHPVSQSKNIRGNDPLLPNISWKEMMRNHDLIWKGLPLEMKEAPHFGNGLIGSMIWFEDKALRLQVFRTDVHDHADETCGWTAYSRPRYQIGYFIIKFKGEVIACDLRQDIYNAELTGSITTTFGSLKIDHFVHRKDDVIYTEIEASGEEAVTGTDWHPFEARTSRGGSPGDAQYGGAYAPYKELNNPGHKVEKHGEVFIGLQDLTAGGDYATAWKEYSQAGNISVLLVTIQNSWPEKQSVESAVRTIGKVQEKTKAGIKSWREEHRAWWHNYYPES